MKIGYARVSTNTQNLASQIDLLKAEGCERIVSECKSGIDSNRGALNKLLSELQPGDILVVVKFDRLSRSLSDLLNLLDKIEASGGHLLSLSAQIDTRIPEGRLVFQILGAMAEFEMKLIRQRTLDGLATANARGRKGGRPLALNLIQIEEVVNLRNAGMTLANLAKKFGVCPSTIWRVCTNASSH